MKLAEIKEAEKTMEELIQLPQYRAYGYYGLGLIKQSLPPPKSQAAFKMFENAIEADSLLLDSYKQIAIKYVNSEKPKKAIATLDRAIAVAPEWPEALLMRAILTAQVSKKYEQPEQDLKYLIELEPNNYYYRFVRGFFFLETKRCGLAVDDFRESFHLRGEVPSQDLGYQYQELFGTELVDLLQYYHKHVNDVSETAKNHLDEGICKCIKAAGYAYGPNAVLIEKSLDDFKEAANYTQHPITDYFLASIYRRTYKNKLAIEAYSRFIDKNPERSQTYLQRGDLHRLLQDYTPAYQDYSAYIEKSNGLLLGYERRAALSYEFKQYQNAYPDYSHIISQKPTDYDVVYKRGICANKIKQYKSSNQDLENCIKFSYCGTFGAHFIKYDNYLHLGDTLKSILSLKKASDIEPHSGDIQLAMIEIGTKLDSTNMVKVAYDRLIKHGGNTFQWFYERGKWNYHQGNFKLAYSDMKRLVEHNKENGEVCYYFGQILLKIGREEEAQEWLKRAEKLKYSPEEE